jgi:hypothetical protein
VSERADNERSIEYLSLDDVRALHVDIMARTGYPAQPLRAPGEL